MSDQEFRSEPTPDLCLSCVQASTVNPRFSLTYTLQRSHCADSAVLSTAYEST